MHTTSILSVRFYAIALCALFFLGAFSPALGAASVSLSNIVLTQTATTGEDEEEEPVQTGGYQLAITGEDEEEEPVQTGGYQFAATGEDEEEEPVQTGGYQFV